MSIAQELFGLLTSRLLDGPAAARDHTPADDQARVGTEVKEDWVVSHETPQEHLRGCLSAIAPPAPVTDGIVYHEGAAGGNGHGGPEVAGQGDVAGGTNGDGRAAADLRVAG